MKKISIFGIFIALYSGISVAGEVNFPEELLPLQVNEREIEHSFFKKVRKLELPAGVHRIKVKYSDLFELDYDEHEVVNSTPFWVEVTIEDRDYNVRFKPISDVEQARDFAKSPKIWLQPQQGDKVSAKQVKAQTAAAPMPVVSEPVITTVKANSQNEGHVEQAAPNAGKPDAVSMLEFWWQQATPEQRIAFLTSIDAKH
ncbi:DUF2057 domain-containing protein [Pseudoalteromonas luteoviolacea]|uniref:DUF2057 domain-containing protein n=1 Tax=Pseudoalteromonas luteoviolacea S4054 TaxID=1129367 RepID=A0A0F6AIP5_9GAMM|nr:DUF2057 domain-containing protein [Pseudoalteromonas luteoviolacea]AOT06480.1 hypothetical protein S4054249_00600 [Pseudoalteromonas luteoviolacea]AOT11397.1 hypothetical protein S40542_00600 [Pseudoalteromonas luteoviolacea]AOT16310.1 hypothetical protein S4054_00600 [Pseudoalteromonas luteoviolacea]KKE85509.1 hypothetical protein N479_04220 [Pseudoalteromonas luteoviolacea S4054]KZN73085.1 hypothetical protein N481_13610 [Pseudoalteromonas luteoviolacea S4047-1]